MADTLTPTETHPIQIKYGEFNPDADQKLIDKLMSFIKENKLNSVISSGNPITIDGKHHVYTSFHTTDEVKKIEAWLNGHNIYRERTT